MPTHFSYAAQALPDPNLKTAGARAGTTRFSEEQKAWIAEDIEELHTREIAAAALYTNSAQDPSQVVLRGPGVAWGPPRFLGTMRLSELYLEFEMWCKVQAQICPSRATFDLAFRGVSCVKLRKNAGQHAACDHCASFKKKLHETRGPEERCQILEEYGAHLLDIWMDRQTASNRAQLSLRCSQALAGGQLLANMSQEVSFVHCMIDGADQAKFRVPRHLVPIRSLCLSWLCSSGASYL